MLFTLLCLQAVEITRDGRALLPIRAAAETRPIAAELATQLERLSGARFEVVDGPGPGVSLKLEKPADEFSREVYRLKSSADGLEIAGATPLALSHAVWDLLHRLGYRQFFPGEAWEVLPPKGDLKIALDVRGAPSFHARRVWYNWGLFGYNNEPYRQWCERNRMAKGFDLQSGHAYDAIYAQNKAEFEKHPEYLALENGARRASGGDIKFCVSNPGLRKLVVEHAKRQVKPGLDSVSMDPSDGDHWCQCEPCAAMGGVSNRVLTLANDVAEAIQPVRVGMYAYNKHSAPPSIKVHPGVIVNATTAFIGGGFTFDQVVQGWQKQGATMGVYDYLSVVDWDWNLPRGGAGSRPAHVAGLLAKIHGMGARFYDAESGDCWGPCGLGYYVASRVLWDVADAQRVPEIVDDFLSRAFLSAKEPMREFYRLTGEDTQRRPSSDLLGRLYRQLDAARKACDDPKVRERLDHLTLWVRYAELYTAHAAGGSKDEVLRHAWRIRTTMMVHTYGLWSRLASQQAALAKEHPLKDERPFTADEIAGIIAKGVEKNVPVEPGFAGVEYSRTLVPATRLKLPAVAPGRFPAAPQDHQEFWLWVEKGPIPLEITVQKVWANRKPKLTLYSPLEVTLDPVTVDETPQPDGKPYAVSLKTPHAGLHRLVAVDGGDHSRVVFPEGMPVTVESGIDGRHVTSQFRGAWTLYLYVPKGAKLVGGWSSRIANWAPKPSGRLVDPSGAVALDFAKLEEGWFKAPVPEGRDGALWKFEDCVGQRLLMTVPPYLARRAEELLLPAEVVEADAKP
ncbi:MAG TPA: DUF4838 domain-containing protein [Planctomycetota bacterium]